MTTRGTLSAKELVRRLRADGWIEKRKGPGDHVQVTHPAKTGRVTVDRGSRDIPMGSCGASTGWRDGNGDRQESRMSEVVYGLIHEAKGRYGISFPDFPGCVAAGATPDEALRRGAETLRFRVADMIEDGEALPKLRGLSELQRSKVFRSDAKGAAVVGVNVELPGKSVRVNISLEERLLEAIDRAASHSGQSRSAFLAEAAARRIKSAA